MKNGPGKPGPFLFSGMGLCHALMTTLSNHEDVAGYAVQPASLGGRIFSDTSTHTTPKAATMVGAKNA